MTLEWDYDKHQVHLSTPEYCKDALIRFSHNLRKVNNQPHKHAIPVYGRKIQHAKEEDTTPNLDKHKTKFLQQVTGTFLYYAHAVDLIVMVALNAIASDHEAPT